MGFHSVRLPTGSYGSSGGPTFDNAVVDTRSGRRYVVAGRDQPLHRYNIANQVKSHEAAAALRQFYIARGGKANAFLFKDMHDFHSNPANPTFTAAPGTADQRLGYGDGSRTAFQLVKTYSSGPTSLVRPIRKPVTTTVRVWVAGVELSSGAFSVNADTGVVTLASAPTMGQEVRASFEFDVPVSFEEDALDASLDSFGTSSLDDVGLVEVLDPDPPSVGEFLMGGATEVVAAQDVSMSTSFRLWVVSTPTAGKSAILPATAQLPPGGPYFYVRNVGPNSLAVKTSGGSTVVTLGANTSAELLLSVDGGGSKTWEAF